MSVRLSLVGIFLPFSNSREEKGNDLSCEYNIVFREIYGLDKRGKWCRHLFVQSVEAPKEFSVEYICLPPAKSQEKSREVKFKLEPWKSLADWIQWCASS